MGADESFEEMHRIARELREKNSPKRHTPVLWEIAPGQVRWVEIFDKVLAVPLVSAAINIGLWLWLDVWSPEWVILLTAIVAALWIAYNYEKYSTERSN